MPEQSSAPQGGLNPNFNFGNVLQQDTANIQSDEWPRAVAAAQRLSGDLENYKTAALTDALTGLPNRRAFLESLQESVANNKPFGIFALDLDAFKRVNDTYGHPVGDELLKLFGSKFSSVLRANDTITAELSRPAGDEFFVKVDLSTPPRENFHDPDRQSSGPLTEDDRMKAVEDHLKEVIIEISGTAISDTDDKYADVGFDSSFGCAIWHPGDDVTQKLAEADANLYAHKNRASDPSPSVEPQ